MKGSTLVVFITFGLFVQVPVALAATAFVSAPRGFTAIHYVAAAGETNNVTVSVNSASDLDIIDPGATITAGSGCTSIGAHEVTCSRFFDPIEVRLGDGNDVLVLDYEDDGGGAYFGDAGNDRILGGGDPWSGEFLSGGPGDDVLRGRVGDDELKGGAGADVMSGGSSTACEFLGCFPNQDTVTYAQRTTNVHAVADGVADDGSNGEGDLIKSNVERILGGSGDDVLGGDATTVRRFTDGGKVRLGMELRGREGNDILRGGRSGDYLLGGRGNDILRGRGLHDSLLGSLGKDVLFGGKGHDDLLGGSGDDHLFARDQQRDQVGGGRGRDKGRVDIALDHVRRVEQLL